MGYPGPGPITRYYRNCLLCGCPFAVRPYEVHLTDRGKFCSRMCYHSSRHLFTQALADGRLDVILAPERAAARGDYAVADERGSVVWDIVRNHRGFGGSGRGSIS